MIKKFQIVCGLWVTPEFPEVTADLAPALYVEHSAIPFTRLHRALLDMFPYGPHVKIQVPNDTIDEVSVRVRQNGKSGASTRCEDFGLALLKCAKKSDDVVVNVRRAWRPLHALPDRDFAPLPAILPLVITAMDYEDAMSWHASARACLRLPVFEPTIIIQQPEKARSNLGCIPHEFQQTLATIFGYRFKATVVLDKMAADPVPLAYSL